VSVCILISVMQLQLNWDTVQLDTVSSVSWVDDVLCHSGMSLCCFLSCTPSTSFSCTSTGASRRGYCRGSQASAAMLSRWWENQSHKVSAHFSVATISRLITTTSLKLTSILTAPVSSIVAVNFYSLIFAVILTLNSISDSFVQFLDEIIGSFACYEDTLVQHFVKRDGLKIF